jgi:hypothetical protein
MILLYDTIHYEDSIIHKYHMVNTIYRSPMGTTGRTSQSPSIHITIGRFGSFSDIVIKNKEDDLLPNWPH